MTTEPATTVATPVPPPTSTTDRPGPDPRYRLTPLRLLRSEILRLVTVRSVLWTLGAFALLMLVIGAVASATATGEVSGVGPDGAPAPGFSGGDPLQTVLAGQTPGILVVGVLGVLVGAREFASGMIRTSVAAAPRRTGLLLARLGAFVSLVLPVAVLSSLGAWVLGTAILDAGGAATAAWSDAGVPRAVLGTGLYLTVIGLLGVCLGMLTRGIGQGIGWLVGLVLVLPGFGSILLPDDAQGVLDYLPSNAGAAFTGVSMSSTDGLGVCAGLVVLTVWLVAALVGSLALFRRRDV